MLVARNRNALTSLQRELETKHGTKVRVLCQDLSEVDATKQLVNGTADLDIGLLIYNAGGDPYISHFLDTDDEHWSKLLRLNTETVLRTCHHFGKAMVARRRGGVLLVGSHSALGGVRKLAMYSATKAFILNLGESLWAEWQNHGVDVLNLLISTVDTPIIRETMQRLNLPHALTLELPAAADIANLALGHLTLGPTLIHPEDLNSKDQDVASLPGPLRKNHVIKKSDEAAVFIGT